MKYNKYKYNYEEVKKEAEGQWLRIYAILAPELEMATLKLGRHVPCPIHKGKDGFRLFKDAALNGGGLSNKDGAFPNGFALLMWLKRWDFPTALKEVATSLGIDESNKNGSNKNVVLGEIEYYERPFEAFGEFVKCGFAPYKFQNGKSQSFYVVLKDNHGNQKTIWGIDLKDSLNTVSEGDKIVLKRIGKQAVSIVDDHKIINTHRNVWEVYNHTTQTTTQGIPQKTVQPLVNKNVPEYVPQAESVSEQRTEICEEERDKRNKTLAKIWMDSVELDSDNWNPVKHYLKNRNVLSQVVYNSPDEVRFNQALQFWEFSEEENKPVLEGTYPSMVCAVRNVKGEVVSLHRTYLTAEGKKISHRNCKKLLSPISKMAGSAIRLGGIPADGVLGISEGIENALAVTKATGLVCWSAISTWGLESFEPPKGVVAVIIWADNDKNEAGLESAKKLAKRLNEQGIPCTIALPKRGEVLPDGVKSIDWNDILVEEGYNAFPNLQPVRIGLLNRVND